MSERALPEWVRRSRDSAAGTSAPAGAVPGSETPPGDPAAATTAEPDPGDEPELPVDEVDRPALAAVEPEEPPLATPETVLPVTGLPVTGHSATESPGLEDEPLPETLAEEPPPVSEAAAWAPAAHEPVVEAVVESVEHSEPFEAAPPAIELEPAVEAHSGPPPIFEGGAWAPPEPDPEPVVASEVVALVSPEYEPPAVAAAEPSAAASEAASAAMERDPLPGGPSERPAWMPSEAEPVDEVAPEQAPLSGERAPRSEEDERPSQEPWEAVRGNTDARAEPAGAEADAGEVDPVGFADDVVETGEVAELGVALVPSPADFARLEATANVVESLNLGFHLGSAVERIAAAAGQGSEGIPALRQAAWLIERYVALLERRPIGADLHLSAARLARTGDTITDLKALAAALDGAYADSRSADVVAAPGTDTSAGDAGAEPA